MPDLKITQLTADTAPASDDLIITVDNVAVSPVNKKVTLGDLFAKPPAIGGTTPAAGAFTSVNWAKAADIADSATPAIGAAAGNVIDINGTTTITGFDNVAAGITRHIRFMGVRILTHSATLILPGSRNLTTAVGDRACFVSHGGGTWLCQGYLKANGAVLGDVIIVTAPDSDSAVAAANMYGQTHLCGFARTYTLPPAVVGMSATFRASAAVVVSIKPDATGTADNHILNQTLLASSNKVTSGGTQYAAIYMECTKADLWDCYSCLGIWVDGGA